VSNVEIAGETMWELGEAIASLSTVDIPPEQARARLAELQGECVMALRDVQSALDKLSLPQEER
jgi:hypothetical protein